MSSLSPLSETPCVGVCSTAIGDDVCRGCARTFAEISFWGELSAKQKAQCWASLPVRRVWLAVVRGLPGHLQIESSAQGEYALLQWRAGGQLRLAQPYLAGEQRVLPLYHGTQRCLLDVARDDWPQQLQHWLHAQGLPPVPACDS